MRSLKNESGSVLVFVTLMIILLMVMVGMGMDTGTLTYSRSLGQGAVDAAALSAVSGVPISDAEVKARAGGFNTVNDYVGNSDPAKQITGSNVTYVQYNDATGAITALPNRTGANGVRVALEQTNPYNGANAASGINTPAYLTPLMKLFGGSAPGTNNVNVSAVAALKALPSVPIAIMTALCQGSSTVNDVKLLQSDATSDNSCWTTYTDNPPSEKRVRDLFANSATCSNLPASSELITIGTLIEVQNGQDTKTYQAAEDLFTKDPTNCWMVPVLPNSTKCNQSDPIVDWASICPTKFVSSGSPKYIQVNLTCQQTLFRANNNLCFSPRLIREPGKGY